MTAPNRKTRVLFVCMGNICRSPTAEGVFRRRAELAGMADWLLIDSAGTHGSHEGDLPDARAITAAKRRGYDLSGICSRPVMPSDFGRFDYVLGMDEYNLRLLRAMKPPESPAYVGRLLDFAPHLGKSDIDDPYYGGPHHFEEVLDQIEAAAEGLLRAIRQRGKPA